MSMFGEIKPFDGDKWEVFVQQLECFILVNDISDDKKVPLLITKLTPKVFETLSCLCAPNKPTKLSYEELCTKLKEKYTKPVSTVLERAEFRRRKQLPRESIEDYALELRKMANRCNFKDIDDQLKEKFMDGVTSKVIKFELMKGSADLTLEACIQLARTVEAALLHTGDAPETTEVFFTQEQRKPNMRMKIKKNNNANTEMHCFCCGKNNHIKSQCSLAKKFCSECGQQGHIYRMCQRRKREAHVLEAQTPEEVKEEPVENIRNLYDETYAVHSVSRIPPHFITLNVNGYDMSFQLDTGSDVTVVSMSDKAKYLNTFTLEESNIIFKNFDQSITKPLGILTKVPVTLNQVRESLNIFVVNNNSPIVIGRDWLNALKLWPPNVQNGLDLGNNTVLTVSDARRNVKEQFAEVFSPGWGNFKDEVITLKLKPGTQPKCLPVRRVPYALRDKVKHEINRLLENGRISPVEHCEWGTPVVPILKPDGAVRLCGDYKLTVNTGLEIDHFPLPHIDDILNTLKDGQYYCELDLKEAYLQAPLSEDSKNCTTIVTEAVWLPFAPAPPPRPRAAATAAAAAREVIGLGGRPLGAGESGSCVIEAGHSSRLLHARKWRSAEAGTTH
ncbi:unnamed protein product [Plutella xylostella]|uniref:(diamondback moth) hypothetical protein n=1 Tax=Plutella xylostella TaxID=51655 RepID=A0A8S4G2W5_PLUXY|nr:unnamed protein product [Plutella xylostella]